jgi:hypothetical protein
LITDVFRLRLHPCTIITLLTPAKIAGRRYLTFKLLDEGHQSDMRDFPGYRFRLRSSSFSGHVAHPGNEATSS